MISKFIIWAAGSWNTWRIKRDNPALYKWLSEYEFDPADFTERTRPERLREPE